MKTTDKQKEAGNSKSSVLSASLILIMALITFFPLFLTAQSNEYNENWGTRPYAEEAKIFLNLVNKLKKENHPLWSAYNQSKNDLDAYWGEWSKEEKAKAEKWFKTSSYYPTKLAGNMEYLEPFYEKDKALWDELTANSRMLPVEQWKSYLKFLRNEQELFYYRVTYYNNKLLAMKVYGGDWVNEFAEECIEDYYEVLAEVVTKLSDELLSCFKGALTSALKLAITQSVTEKFENIEGNVKSVKGGVISCIKDIPLKSVINALEAAVKRHFIKEMKEKEIDELVAAYWWDKVVMGREKEPLLAEAIDGLMSVEFWTKELSSDKVKKWAADSVVPQIKKETKRLFDQEFKKEILDKGLRGSDAEKAFREKYKKFVDDIAEERTEDHVYNQYLQAALFAYDYLNTAHTALISGRGKFDAIAEKLYAKHRHVKECLVKKKEEPTGQRMLAIFQKNENEFNNWYKDYCSSEITASLEASLNKYDEILKRMKDKAEKGHATVIEGDKDCQSAKEQIKLAEDKIDAFKETSKNNESMANELDTLKETLENALANLHALKQQVDDDAVAAGLYKRYCENEAYDACQQMLLLRRIKGSKEPRMIDMHPDPELSRDPGEVLGAAQQAVTNAGANKSKVEEYMQSLKNDVQEAEKLKDEVITAIETFQKKYQKDSTGVSTMQNAIKAYVGETKLSFSALQDKIATLNAIEQALKNDYAAAYTLLMPYETNSKAKEMLGKIASYRDDFIKEFKELQQCLKDAERQLEQVEKNAKEIDYEMDNKRETDIKYGLSYYEIEAQKTMYAIGIESNRTPDYIIAAESAVKNAQICLEEAQKFYDTIKELLTDEGAFSTSGGETTTGDEGGRCNFLKQAFYGHLHQEYAGHIKDAENILNDARNCPWYEEGLRDLEWMKNCAELDEKFIKAQDAGNWQEAKRIAQQKPECFPNVKFTEEGDEGGFSTSGGETTAETSPEETVQAGDDCSSLENTFHAALDSGDLQWAQSVLNMSGNCNFYTEGMDTINNAYQQQQENIRKSEEDRCSNLQYQFADAANSGDLNNAEAILQQATTCWFYNHALQWLQQARHNQYCIDMGNQFANALNRNDLNYAQSILNTAANNNCTIPDQAYQALQQARDNANQQQQQRTQNIQRLLNEFVGIIQDANRNRNTNTWKPPVINRPPAPPTNRPPAQTNTPPQAPVKGRSREECINKYCPMCKQSVQLLGEYADPKCQNCIKSNATKIDQCVAGK
ncbi:MAG: hypothetical protein A2Y62_04865 [Candidatus Fischerbacteria bacterium RBG_13_37_8]|uniref:Uncharacterized protein n=1 Tax=Candidatus Fischerbacteria bacterium RBG_13_37_8 TaxID=1817863 RepID=A0A1F5VHR4_9BACT|nr:MAG: hypothetical protein A2Y62_04865 [Candidatus Fischerbacteria bacterium RBG_13_37_8]